VLSPRTKGALIAAAVTLTVLGAGAAYADGDPARPQALGRVFAAGPDEPGVAVLSTGGYGYTESVLGRDDGHHRVAGSLAVEGRPLRWLDLALRVDGRYDAHVIPGQPFDDGFIGEPRLYVRADRRLGDHLLGGARLGVWLPGGNAPSVDLAAATPELVAALTFTPGALPLWLTANAGYRWDRSARSAANAARLSAGDRLALEVSAFDQALFGLAAAYGAGAWQPFAEASCDLLMGAGAPAASVSPMRIGAGARFTPRPGLRLEAEAELSPSARPDLAATAPPVPVPPRLAVWVGLAYRFGESKPPPPSPVLTPMPLAATEPAARAVTPEEASAEAHRLPSGQLRGLVRSLSGRPVPAEIRVDPAGRALRAVGGRFEIDVPPGAYEVTIAAPGFATQKRRVQVEQNGVTLLDVDLRSEK
jgi:hypothetical protein